MQIWEIQILCCIQLYIVGTKGLILVKEPKHQKKNRSKQCKPQLLDKKRKIRKLVSQVGRSQQYGAGWYWLHFESGVKIFSPAFWRVAKVVKYIFTKTRRAIPLPSSGHMVKEKATTDPSETSIPLCNSKLRSIFMEYGKRKGDNKSFRNVDTFVQL